MLGVGILVGFLELSGCTLFLAVTVVLVRAKL